jgi:hypothetical protein
VVANLRRVAVSQTEVVVYPTEGAVSHNRVAISHTGVAVLHAGLDVKQNRLAVRYTGKRGLGCCNPDCAPPSGIGVIQTASVVIQEPAVVFQEVGLRVVTATAHYRI